MAAPAAQPGSSSLDQPDYWWFRARAELLHTVLGPYFGRPATILDVGSADGPSVGWMKGGHRRITLDLFFDAIRRGTPSHYGRSAPPAAAQDVEAERLGPWTRPDSSVRCLASRGGRVPVSRRRSLHSGNRGVLGSV